MKLTQIKKTLKQLYRLNVLLNLFMLLNFLHKQCIAAVASSHGTV